MKSYNEFEENAKIISKEQLNKLLKGEAVEIDQWVYIRLDKRVVKK